MAFPSSSQSQSAPICLHFNQLGAKAKIFLHVEMEMNFTSDLMQQSTFAAAYLTDIETNMNNNSLQKKSGKVCDYMIQVTKR